MLRRFLQPQLVERIEPRLAPYLLQKVALLSHDSKSHTTSVPHQEGEGKQWYPSLDGSGIREGVDEFNEEMEELFGPLDGSHHQPQEEDTQQRQALFGSSAQLQQQHQHQHQHHQQDRVKWEDERGRETKGNSGPASSSSSASSSTPPKLTHVSKSGDYHMVDVGGKQDTHRMAAAEATVVLGPEVFGLVAEDKLKKGNVLAVAQIAGIQAAKKTSDLIPLCHNIQLNQIEVDCKLEPESSSVQITSMAKTMGKTGVEMEALTACTVAALTVYDMCKAASKATKITNIALVKKSGGKSGNFDVSK